MNREVHVRFWESPEVKVLRATRQSRRFGRRKRPPTETALLFVPGVFQKLDVAISLVG
jgi:hypothetical protein